MRAFRRAFPFLLLNIVISAATTLAILYWVGGGFRGTASQAPSPTLAAILQPTAVQLAPTQTASAGTQALIEIVKVQGAGEINNEAVTLRRLGEGDLRITGWKLEDNAGHHFVFPELVLNKDGAIQVFTGTGQNTVITLYWGLGEAVWAVGKTVYLYDPQGVVRATLVIR